MTEQEENTVERNLFRQAFCSRWVIHQDGFGYEDREANGEDFENCIFEVQMAWVGWKAKGDNISEELNNLRAGKARLAEMLGLSDEPRWKWLLIEVADMQHTLGIGNDKL